MAFKNSQSANGFYLSDDFAFISADNTKDEGYDATTVPSNEVKLTLGNDAFGSAVAIGSNKIVIGDYLNDDATTNAGAIYIYELDGTLLSTITASDASSSDQFGYSVAIGNSRIVVGAPFDDDAGSASGSAYIFDLDGNQIAKITASDAAGADYFGQNVAVGYGRIVIGAIGNDDAGSVSGSAYIFDLDGNQLTKITASDAASGDNFGSSVAIGNGRIIVGASQKNSAAGAAYIFDLNGNELSKITASNGSANNQFGYSVAIGSGRIVVAAPFADYLGGEDKGYIYIFDLNGNELNVVMPSDPGAFNYFGRSVAVGNGRIVVGSDRIDDGAADTGAAYIFDLDGNQLDKINASDAAGGNRFGWATAVGYGKIIIGTYLATKAYIYTTPNTGTHALDILE